MDPYPHHYRATAGATATGDVALDSPGLTRLESAPPPEFGGPGDRWSPETLLAAAVADCFVLTFRAVSRASGLAWEDLRCDAEATLDRADGVTRFTGYRVRAWLTVPAGTDRARAERLLQKAEHACMITNSLNGTTTLETDVVEREAEVPA